MNFIKNFIKNKTITYFIACGVALLSLVTAIIYVATLGHLKEMSWVTFSLLLVAPFVFVGLSLLKYERIGIASVGILNLLAFIFYISTIYEYPITQLMIISNLNDLKEFPAIILCAILMLGCFIACNVFYWMKTRKNSIADKMEVGTNE